MRSSYWSPTVRPCSFISFIRVITLLSTAVLTFGLPAQGQVQTPPTEIESPYELNVDGTLSWVLKYGLGDSRGLSKKGFANILLLEQHISVDVDGSVKVSAPISGALTISAQLDNQKADNLQTLRMGFRNESLSLSFGDFRMGRAGSDFAASDRTLKGLELTYLLSDSLKFLAQAARVEGDSQVRIFHGNTSHAQTLFSLYQPDRPGLEQTYELSLQGLEYYPLTNFVEGFTIVELTFPVSAELLELLTNYGLDFIYEQIQDEPATELDRYLYEVIPEDTQSYLALRRAALDLLRSQIRNYIDIYNEDHDLFGDEAKPYPLIEGTDYELGFLNKLARLVTLTTPEDELLLESYRRGRFFHVGYAKIIEATVKIEVKLAGQFLEITDPSIRDIYKAKIFAELGILDLQFPPDFFHQPESEVRVEFDYSVPGQVYILGFSILKDSDRVYLNGKRLQREEDYEIDYETGALILFTELGEEDTLRIEYELLRGGLGSAVDFQRSFVGGTISWTPFSGFSLNLDIFRAADNQPSPEGKERRSTMPNAHTVIGLTGQLDLPNFQTRFKIGFDQNVFPPGDPKEAPGRHTNQKTNLPNQINAIASFPHNGQTVIVFGHQNGFTVFDGQRWEGFGTMEGLSGSTVYSIIARPDLLLIGTEFGLTQVQLEPGVPALSSLAKPLNWKRLREGERDGNLPHNSVYALFLDQDQRLWLGTGEGLASVPLSELTQKSAWKIYKLKENSKLLSDKILSLGRDGRYLSIGTEKGLALLDTETDEFLDPIEELRNQRVVALLRLGEEIYGATGRGLFAVSPPRTLSWAVENRKAQALALHNAELWYGTDEGLFKFPEDLPKIKDRSITALGSSAVGLWGGQVANANYELPVWRVRGTEISQYPPSQTRINGRDERRFAEIDPAQNTDYGWTAQVSTRLSLGRLQLSAQLEGVTPEFLAIGREERQDIQQLVLSGSYPFSLPFLGQLSLSGRHAMGMLNLSQTRLPRELYPVSGTMKDSINLDWTMPWGPKLGFGFSLDQIENDPQSAGFDTQSYSYQVSLSQNFALRNLFFFWESLSLSGTYSLLDYQVHNKKDVGYKDEKIAASASTRLIGGLSFNGSFTQTTKTRADQTEGDRAYSWRGDWRGLFGFMTLNSSYSQSYRLRLADEKGSRDDSANLDLRLQQLELGDLTLSPGLSGSFRMNVALPEVEGTGPTVLTLTGEGRTRADWLDFSGQASYRYTFSRDRRRDQLREEISGSIDWAALADLQPGLDFSLVTETLIRLDTKEIRKTGRQSVAVHLDWEISPEMHDVTSLRWQATQSDREETHSFALGSKLDWTMSEKLAARLEGNVTYALGIRKDGGRGTHKFESELIGYADYRLGADLTASFSMGGLGGLDIVTPRNSYLSAIFSVQGTLLFGTGQR